MEGCGIGRKEYGRQITVILLSIQTIRTKSSIQMYIQKSFRNSFVLLSSQKFRLGVTKALFYKPLCFKLDADLLQKSAAYA